MNLFKKLTLAAVVAAAVSLSAQDGNLIKYGDFENLPAGSTSMAASMKKSGLDINRDPVCLTPGWYVKKNQPSIKVVDAEKDGKDAVKSGKGAMNVKAQTLHAYTGNQYSMGTYDISFAYKGKGILYVSLYFYNANGKHLGNSAPKVTIKPTANWQTFNGKIKITPEKPDTSKARLVFIFVSSDITIDDIVLKPSK